MSIAEDVKVVAPDAVDITGGEGGVFKKIAITSTCTKSPKPGDRVSVHYVGTLLDGTPFDSSRDRGEEFTFNIGNQEVIRGWDVGVASMKTGERAMFYISSEYGYGVNGSPPKIPGNATLVFDIELFSFQGEDVTKDKDGGVVKSTLTPGTGHTKPNDGAKVEIGLLGKCNDKVFDERTVHFELGEGTDTNIPTGVEMCIKKMKNGEKAEVTVMPKYGFGEKGWTEKGVGPAATLTYEVELKSHENVKESWQLDADEKLEQAKIIKDRGTEFLKAGKMDLASDKYSKVIDYLEHELSLKGDAEVERKTVLKAGRLNLCLVKLKLEDWLGARDQCAKVLEEDEACHKAWFRRGEANYNLNEWWNAKTDFETTFKLDPGNKAAANKIKLCEQKIKQYEKKQKTTFANMFDKFAAIDQKKEEAEKNDRPNTMNNIDEWNNAAKGSDPNSIQVGGDIDMQLDINEAIQQDQEDEAEEE